MIIIAHAQHLSGVGHRMRMDILARTLSHRHETYLVAGGRHVPHPGGEAVTELALAALERGPNGMRASDGRPLAMVLAERAKSLGAAVEALRPHVLLIEHYPFSKWELAGEVSTAVAVARRSRPYVRVLCSLRDIAPQTRHEAVDPDRYRARVRETLVREFDGVLVHGDPTVTPLSDREMLLPVPVAYTGVVCPEPPLVTPSVDTYAVVSCGGGAGELVFVTAAMNALREALPTVHVRVFAGLFVSPAELAALECEAARLGDVTVVPFAGDFPAWLEGAALSVSRAGYNTCARLLSSRTGVPAVLVPNPQMSDQVQRASVMAKLGWAAMVLGDPPEVTALARQIRATYGAPRGRCRPIAIDGARRTRELIEVGFGEGGRGGTSTLSPNARAHVPWFSEPH